MSKRKICYNFYYRSDPIVDFARKVPKYHQILLVLKQSVVEVLLLSNLSPKNLLLKTDQAMWQLDQSDIMPIQTQPALFSIKPQEQKLAV